MISQFRGQFRFLSNFYPSAVVLDDVEYATVEHAYQAAKTLDAADRRRIQNARGPANAKRIGNKVALRDGWDDMKIGVMLDLLRQKFADPDLRTRLLRTGHATLVEGNTWGDVFWGVCDGRGSNNLGALLMRVRREIRVEESV